MTSYTLFSNRTTNHIGGLSAVLSSDFTMNHCGALSRGRLAAGPTTSDLAEALKMARLTGGRKICKTCEKVAEAMIEAAKAEEVEETVTEAPAPELAVLIAYSDGTTETLRVTGDAEAATRIHLARKSGHRAIRTMA